MVTIENDDLRETYHCSITLRSILDRDLPRIQNDKSYLDNLVPEGIRGLYTKKQNAALKFKDAIEIQVYDTSLVALVTTFEKVAFAKYRTSYGTIKTVVAEKAEHPLDYFASRERFINTSIDKLAGIFFLIEGIIDADTMQKLNVIKEHRNYIVHGKRDSAPPAFEYDIDTVARFLDKAITEISVRD
jgi:hypothetical protein